MGYKYFVNLGYIQLCRTCSFGRRVTCCLALTLQFFVNIIMPFSFNVYMFICLRFLDGYAGNTVYTLAFIISLELVSVEKRQLSGTLILLVFAFGTYILLILAFLIRDWRWLQLAVAVPMVVFITYWWPKILPESVRWLISRGRDTEALVILRRVARVNKKQLHLEEYIKTLKTEKEKDEGIMQILKRMVSSRKLILRLVIVLGNWAVIALIYYGIQLNIGKLSGDLYLNFLYNTCAETVAYLLMFLINRTGRRPMWLGTMFLLGGVCLASIFTVLFLDQSLSWITVSLAVAGKLLVSLAFGVLFIYTGELFPTVVRSLVMAICGFGARMGSLVTPYLYSLVDGKLKNGVPFMIYSVFVILMAFLSIMLPETNNKRLLETMNDVSSTSHRNTEQEKEVSQPLTVPDTKEDTPM